MESRAAEESREHEAHDPHGWGDTRTWILLGILIGGAIVHTFVIRAFVGQHILGPEEWNLGYPPTAPAFLLPLLGNST